MGQRGAAPAVLTRDQGGDRETAYSVACHVARRLRDPALVEAATAHARRTTEHPRSVHWRAGSLWQGDTGLALLWSAMDRCQPGEGWDRVGLEHLQRAGRDLEARADPGIGLA